MEDGYIIVDILQDTLNNASLMNMFLLSGNVVGVEFNRLVPHSSDSVKLLHALQKDSAPSSAI